ncbi:MAG: hypothetical protein JW763_06585 [candidate division Zixibacteria bacterium]|nr:hypothetical protein [candidate division Zixibacteria bacterium]
MKYIFCLILIAVSLAAMPHDARAEGVFYAGMGIGKILAPEHLRHDAVICLCMECGAGISSLNRFEMAAHFKGLIYNQNKNISILLDNRFMISDNNRSVNPYMVLSFGISNIPENVGWESIVHFGFGFDTLIRNNTGSYYELRVSAAESKCTTLEICGGLKTKF